MQQLHRHISSKAPLATELPAAAAAVATATAAAAAATAAAAAVPLPPTCSLTQQRSHSTTSTGRYTVTAGGEPAAPGATVVLVSGGVEAAALLQTWKHWDHGHGPFAASVLPLFVDFGHRNAAQERRAAAAVCHHVGLELASLSAVMLSHQLLSFAEVCAAAGVVVAATAAAAATGMHVDLPCCHVPPCRCAGGDADPGSAAAPQLGTPLDGRQLRRYAAVGRAGRGRALRADATTRSWPSAAGPPRPCA